MTTQFDKGDHVEVRCPGLVFWGRLVIIDDINRPTIYFVKPDGRNPAIGRAIRVVRVEEVRKLSLLELIAEAASEEFDDGAKAS